MIGVQCTRRSACEPLRSGRPRGLRATTAIIEWLERNGKGQVGGIVREGTALYDVLRRRGYEVSAHVLTKAVA